MRDIGQRGPGTDNAYLLGLEKTGIPGSSLPQSRMRGSRHSEMTPTTRTPWVRVLLSAYALAWSCRVGQRPCSAAMLATASGEWDACARLLLAGALKLSLTFAIVREKEQSSDALRNDMSKFVF